MFLLILPGFIVILIFVELISGVAVTPYISDKIFIKKKEDKKGYYYLILCQFIVLVICIVVYLREQGFF